MQPIADRNAVGADAAALHVVARAAFQRPGFLPTVPGGAVDRQANMRVVPEDGRHFTFDFDESSFVIADEGVMRDAG